MSSENLSREDDIDSLFIMTSASDLCEYTREEVARLTRVAAALSLANGKEPLPIISVDKANVMATSRLWRQVVTETIRDEFPQLVDHLSHHLVDSAAMVLARDPRKLNGVVLTENVSCNDRGVLDGNCCSETDTLPTCDALT